MSEVTRRSASGKEFVVLMAICMSIVALSIDAMLPALGIIGRQLHASSPNQAQLVISCIFIGMAVGQLVCGPLSDAIGRKPLLLGSFALYLVGTVICLLSTSMPMILAGRLIEGLGVAGPRVSTLSIVRDRHFGPAMAKIMSLIMMIFIMVPVLAPTLGQGLLYIGSWRLIFALFFLFAVVTMVWVWFRLEETLEAERRIPFSLKNIARGLRIVIGNRATLCYTMCAGFAFACMIGYLNSCLQIFRGIFLVGDSFALYFGGLAMTLGVSSLFNSRIVGIFGMRKICGSAMTTMIASTLLSLLLATFTDLPLWYFVAYMATQFFCLGLMFGNINALAMEPMGKNAGIASAVIGSISLIISIPVGTFIGQHFNGTLFPILLGFLASVGSGMVFFVLAVYPRKAGEVRSE